MALEQGPAKDWYGILGAEPSANVSELKQKYQKLILMYHPDKQSTAASAGTPEECLQKFIEVDQAWKILGNEAARKEYDLQRHEDELRSMGPIDAQMYLEEMSWNEDSHQQHRLSALLKVFLPERHSPVSGRPATLCHRDVRLRMYTRVFSNMRKQAVTLQNKTTQYPTKPRL
ncbi:dnaJ homolog subfamily C member 24 isoform X1 [Heterocephalus glaber]|uniref:DnaJ homolog subfamily C member 24 isoform X1 n=1 Tax=Heterocephalus glaber TaxID=10181 RepID=A0AAX6TBA5_HETGA|nr:dnaJ homolog subfamily C member 24 isoform X1 [Heterocephalus glaber]XP_021119638.1 dnaJ homolog subfamily C member 24 isoform X1 [Heterocephalus glaber]